jgi:hypothetical protein
MLASSLAAQQSTSVKGQDLSSTRHRGWKLRRDGAGDSIG